MAEAPRGGGSRERRASAAYRVGRRSPGLIEDVAGTSARRAHLPDWSRAASRSQGNWRRRRRRPQGRDRNDVSVATNAEIELRASGPIRSSRYSGVVLGQRRRRQRNHLTASAGKAGPAGDGHVVARWTAACTSAARMMEDIRRPRPMEARARKLHFERDEKDRTLQGSWRTASARGDGRAIWAQRARGRDQKAHEITARRSSDK